MSVKSARWPLWAVLLASLALPLAGGCSRYDSYERNMERNMRYVSGPVLISESVESYQRLRTAHDAWRASSRPEDLDTFRNLYGQYEVIFNELMDRAGGHLNNHLTKFAEVMPPPPPGVPIEGLPVTPLPPPVSRDEHDGGAPLDRSKSAKAAKTPLPAGDAAPDQATAAPETAPAAPAKASEPKRPAKPEKQDQADPAQPADTADPPAAKPAKAKKPKPEAAATATEDLAADGSYVLRPGDTPHRLANRFQVSQARLMAANAIADPQRLAVGQRLVIPRD